MGERVNVADARLGAPRIEVRGATRTFGSGAAKTTALDDVSTTIEAGHLTVILGQSGSGKSTLLNLIGGMDRPDAGSVVVDGRDITRLKDRELTEFRRTTVGFVFQFYNLVANLTAVENVALAAAFSLGRRAAMSASMEALESVGLSHKTDAFPRQLSGGQMQRVAIARALVKRPRLLLCDEPTGALDSASAAEVIELLRETAGAQQTAVVLVTHNHELAVDAGHMLRVGDGRIIEERRASDPRS